MHAKFYSKFWAWMKILRCAYEPHFPPLLYFYNGDLLFKEDISTSLPSPPTFFTTKFFEHEKRSYCTSYLDGEKTCIHWHTQRQPHLQKALLNNLQCLCHKNKARKVSFFVDCPSLYEMVCHGTKWRLKRKHIRNVNCFVG